jgi:hypothetical protein
MAKGRAKNECKGISARLDRAMMRYEQAEISGKATSSKAAIVRKLRAIKRRCMSDVTEELRFNGLKSRKRRK